MDRVRYAGNGDNKDEVEYFILIKGLKFSQYPQWEIKKIIEQKLNQFENIWYCERVRND